MQNEVGRVGGGSRRGLGVRRDGRLDAARGVAQHRMIHELLEKRALRLFREFPDAEHCHPTTTGISPALVKYT